MEIRSIKEIYNFRRASAVGVPVVAKVASTLVSWLCWMADIYVGRLDTKMTFLRSVCLKNLGLTIPWYIYGSANLVGRPGCMTYRGRCALIALPACSGHQGFYVGNEGLSVGCTPVGPTKYFWVLGHYRLETFLRSACLGWLNQTLRSNAGYLGVSTLRTFNRYFGFIVDQTQTLQLQLRHDRQPSSFDAPFKTLLDILGYWYCCLRPPRGRHAYKASLRSALPDSLQPCLEIWVSLHFV
jgi:hypothetical protein